MIVGNGLIASAFKPYFSDDKSTVLFASGVSNSREKRTEEFEREHELLLEHLKYEKFMIYFSTCSISDPELRNSPYVLHKMRMEKLVCSTKNYVIFRLPQVVGKSANPYTLTNYIYNQVMTDMRFDLWINARRYLIDIDDLVLISIQLLQSGLFKTVVNMACSHSISIQALVRIFESVLQKKANYTLINAGGNYSIDTDLAAEMGRQIGINFDEHYMERLIRKYYG